MYKKILQYLSVIAPVLLFSLPLSANLKYESENLKTKKEIDEESKTDKKENKNKYFLVLPRYSMKIFITEPNRAHKYKWFDMKQHMV